MKIGRYSFPNFLLDVTSQLRAYSMRYLSYELMAQRKRSRSPFRLCFNPALRLLFCHQVQCVLSFTIVNGFIINLLVI